MSAVVLRHEGVCAALPEWASITTLHWEVQLEQSELHLGRKLHVRVCLPTNRNLGVAAAVSLSRHSPGSEMAVLSGAMCECAMRLREKAFLLHAMNVQQRSVRNGISPAEAQFAPADFSRLWHCYGISFGRACTVQHAGSVARLLCVFGQVYEENQLVDVTAPSISFTVPVSLLWSTAMPLLWAQVASQLRDSLHHKVAGEQPLPTLVPPQNAYDAYVQLLAQADVPAKARATFADLRAWLHEG